MIAASSLAHAARRWWRREARTQHAWASWLMIAAVALGVALRLVQYFSNTSLWLDELAIVNNIAERSVTRLLTEPLSYAQVAPPGFLLVGKLQYHLFGASDHALRLYSLVCGIGSLAAIGLVSERLGRRESAWVAPLLLALSPAFIFQSAQVKPYSGDTLICLALVAVALRLLASDSAGRVFPTALGALAPWFSFPGALTLAAIGLVLVASTRRSRLLPVVAIWGVSTLTSVAYSTTLVSPETNATMQIAWSRSGLGFPPSAAALLPWISIQFRDLLWSEVGLRGVSVWLGVAAAGAIILWRKNRASLAVVVAPIALSVLAALLHRYPLSSRISHWIAALLIILIVVAVAEAARAIQQRSYARFALVPAMLVLAAPMWSLTLSLPPYRVDDVKPVFAEIARQAQSSDRLYVHPGAWHAYRYYGVRTSIPADRVQFGRCDRRSMRESLAQLDSLRGNPRVWVVFAHIVLPRHRELLLAYLDSIGARRYSVSEPDPYVTASASVDAHLYDLSIPERLERTAWNTYPVAPAQLADGRSLCMLGIVPLR